MSSLQDGEGEREQAAMRLGIGHDLKRVALNPQFPYRLASVEEVLALRPELRPPG